MGNITKSKFLSDDELLLLESSLLKSINMHRRDCLLLLLSIHTGARASELLALDKQSVNIKEGSIHIKGLKGSLDREIPLPINLRPVLANYVDSIATDKLFPISYDRFHDLWTHWRPVNNKLHALRHTCAIRLYKKCRDIHLVRYLLGHKSINNTMVYLDFVRSQEDLRKYML